MPLTRGWGEALPLACLSSSLSILSSHPHPLTLTSSAYLATSHLTSPHLFLVPPPFLYTPNRPIVHITLCFVFVLAQFSIRSYISLLTLFPACAQSLAPQRLTNDASDATPSISGSIRSTSSADSCATTNCGEVVDRNAKKSNDKTTTQQLETTSAMSRRNSVWEEGNMVVSVDNGTSHARRACFTGCASTGGSVLELRDDAPSRILCPHRHGFSARSSIQTDSRYHLRAHRLSQNHVSTTECRSYRNGLAGEGSADTKVTGDICSINQQLRLQDG